MHVQELETIRRLRLPLISCIFNDGGYGSEFHKLRAEGLREDGANFGYSDLFRIAEGFGIKGYRIDNLVQFVKPYQIEHTDRGGLRYPGVTVGNVSRDCPEPEATNTDQ